MTQVEQGIIDNFRRYFNSIGEKRSIFSESFALGGQDRKLGGDYLFYAESRFSIIEFKYDHGGLPIERGKNIAKIICDNIKLSHNAYFKDLSEKCHRIAWMNNENRIVFGSYISVVCDNDKSSIFTSKKFCHHCFNPPPEQNIPYESFIEYVDWLTSLQNYSSSNLLIIGTRKDPDASDDEEPELIIEKFKGIEALNNWLERHEPDSSQTSDSIFRP